MNRPRFGGSRQRDPRRSMDTHFYHAALEMKARLEKFSPSMCLAKWLQVSVHLPTGRTHSCYHPPSHPIPLAELEQDVGALHNTRHKIHQRELMLAGQRPEECSYCWNVEDSAPGNLSDRHYRSAENWALPHLEEVRASGAGKKILPRAMEVNFNSTCQLKCSYCSPHLSSSWMKEIKTRGPIRVGEGYHNDLKYFERENLIPRRDDGTNPYARAFWRWWPELYPQLRVFRMTGGEPLLDPNTFRVFEAILQQPNPDLLLALTSNFSLNATITDQFISQAARIANGRFVEKFQLYVSCDSIGPQAEYLREGLSFPMLQRNVERFLEEATAASVTLILTFNNLSVVGLDGYLDWILELRRKHSRYTQRVFFDTPLLRFPAWQSVQLLPARYSNSMEASIAKMRSNLATFQSISSRFHRFLDFEVDRMERNLAWMNAPIQADHREAQRANFHEFFSEFDRRREKHFLRTFPEMQDFWDLCAEASRRRKGAPR